MIYPKGNFLPRHNKTHSLSNCNDAYKVNSYYIVYDPKRNEIDQLDWYRGLWYMDFLQININCTVKENSLIVGTNK